MTAADFKPVNRVMLADAPVLQMLNEKGEYHRANLTDNNISYKLATYGEIVALTRKVIINDDLQAFTRVPALLGVAAACLESDTVWGIIISNPSATYAGDTDPHGVVCGGPQQPAHRHWQQHRFDRGGRFRARGSRRSGAKNCACRRDRRALR